jgi:hypothetical protein
MRFNRFVLHIQYDAFPLTWLCRLTLTFAPFAFADSLPHTLFEDALALHRPVSRRTHEVGCRCRIPAECVLYGRLQRRRMEDRRLRRTWQPILDDQPTGSIGAVTVAPSDPNIIYGGSGEGLQRSDLSTGDGIYKSTDAGRMWTNLGLRDGQQIPQVAVDPRNPNRLFVAVR